MRNIESLIGRGRVDLRYVSPEDIIFLRSKTGIEYSFLILYPAVDISNKPHAAHANLKTSQETEVIENVVMNGYLDGDKLRTDILIVGRPAVIVKGGSSITTSDLVQILVFKKG